MSFLSFLKGIYYLCNSKIYLFTKFLKSTMPVLYNKISNAVLKQQMLEDDTPRTTISFYKYFQIENPETFRNNLYRKFNDLGVLGRVYIASEGINAQISVPTENKDKFREALYEFDPELNGLRLNIAIDDDGKSFWVLRMKVRDKIVADGIEDPYFNPSNIGYYLKAHEVNEMAKDPNTIFVDMRNHYEYEIGHFKNAIEVPSDTFREQLPMAVDMLKDKKDKNIIMYCTGGIRCEKASAYLKHNGFQNVFHVEGGIIEYARQVKNAGLDSQFIGKNFVFDERLGERITDDIIAQCHQCGNPSDAHTNCANDGCHLLFIQCEDCRKNYENCCSPECLEESKLPEEEQRARRAGRENGNKIFNKAKDHPLRKKWHI